LITCRSKKAEKNQNIKKDCEEKIERAKAALKELTDRDSEEL